MPRCPDSRIWFGARVAAPRPRPSGVTGCFYLQAEPKPRTVQALPGPFAAVTDFARQAAVQPGDSVSCVYLQTAFAVPADWHGRVFMASSAPLGAFTLNRHFLYLPESMKRLDITGLLEPHGENTRKWYPAMTLPRFDRPGKITVPKMALQLMP